MSSYPKNFQWSNAIIINIQAVLATQQGVQTDVIYMDGRQAALDAEHESLRNAIAIKTKKEPYDLIIPIDRHAYIFLLSYYTEFFTDQPIVFAALEHYDHVHAQKADLAHKISGILKERPIRENIAMIQTMMPELKTLYILSEPTLQQLQRGDFIQKCIDAMDIPFEVEYVHDLPLEELREKFSHFQENEAMLFIPFYSGNYDQFYRSHRIANAISAFKIPVFATDALFITQGIVGGKSVLTQSLGATTGKLALSVLNNPAAPVTILKELAHEYVFNYEKIQQFNLEPFLLNQSFRFVNSPVRFLDKHKKYVDALFLVLPLLILLILGLIHNIYMRVQNEKKYREAELQKNKHQQFIIQQSKLAEIGEVFSSIAHQWKNPLVEIATIAQEHLFTCKDAQKNETARYVDDIMVQVQYMTNTINEFQQFIMPSASKTVFDVTEAINSMLHVMNHTITYNYIDVTIDKQGSQQLLVNGYKNAFMQGLLNILNNAKDQISKLQAKGQLKRGAININLYNDGNKVIIAISDNGGGIPKEDLPRLFDPYFTTKEEGHGIGLYMAKLIIEEKMEGKIWASNTPSGACFTIILGSAA